MATILSFLEINKFTSNARNSTNPVGELSPIGATYSRDVNTYYDADVSLSVFNIDGTTTEEINLKDGILDTVVGILNRFSTQYNSVISTSSVLNNVINTLNLTANPSINNIAIGTTVLNPMDDLFYPQWFTFDYTVNTVVYSFKIWLSSLTFRVFSFKG